MPLPQATASLLVPATFGCGKQPAYPFVCNEEQKGSTVIEPNDVLLILSGNQEGMEVNALFKPIISSQKKFN